MSNVIPSEVIDVVLDCRHYIWSQKNIEGEYEVLDIELSEIHGKRNATIYLKKGVLYTTMYASDFFSSIIVKEMKEFNPNYYNRIVDTVKRGFDFLLPESFIVLGVYEIPAIDIDTKERKVLILKDQ